MAIACIHRIPLITAATQEKLFHYFPRPKSEADIALLVLCEKYRISHGPEEEEIVSGGRGPLVMGLVCPRSNPPPTGTARFPHHYSRRGAGAAGTCWKRAAGGTCLYGSALKSLILCNCCYLATIYQHLLV